MNFFIDERTTIKTKSTSSLVLENINIADKTFQITIFNKEIARLAIPGQFVSLLCSGSLLRRPFSIASKATESIDIIYKIKGSGTKYLSTLKQGDYVDVLGPLGNGFNFYGKSLLIGAGVGTAPLIFLSKYLTEKQLPFHFVTAFKAHNEIIQTNKHATIITEDGSTKLSGLITEHLAKIISEYKPDVLYSCGPKPVMEYVTQYAIINNLKVEVALERDFACGTGVCMGCVVDVSINGNVQNRRICKDGPVFNGKIVKW